MALPPPRLATNMPGLPTALLKLPGRPLTRLLILGLRAASRHIWTPVALYVLCKSDFLTHIYLQRWQPVPHASKKDELRALVRKNAHKAYSGWNAWTFDDFSYENLRYVSIGSGPFTS